MRLSSYAITSDPIRTTASGSVARLLYSTRSGSCVSVPESIWQRIDNAEWDRCPATVLQRLQLERLVVPDDDNELDAVIDENEQEAKENRTLYQVVQPSAWCQLDCHYCGQNHARRQLPADAQDRFVDRVDARLGSEHYERLEIRWFGAEPTTGLKVMRALTTRLQKVATAHGCTYVARIVTNGMTLSPALARELETDLAVCEAEITLDGTKASHDARRVTKKGGVSFDRILAGVLAVARDTTMRLVVRCNVDRENASQVAPLIRMLADHGVQKRVRFYTAPLHSWGNDAACTNLSPDEYADYELEWLALQVRLGFIPGVLPGRKKIVCMAVRRDAELLDADDNSFNCTEASLVPLYGSPNEFAVRIANGRTPRASPRAEALTRWNSDIRSGAQQACHDCRMLPVCGGQCPKAWHEGHAQCPSAKLNIVGRLNILYALQMSAHREEGALL